MSEEDKVGSLSAAISFERKRSRLMALLRLSSDSISVMRDSSEYVCARTRQNRVVRGGLEHAGAAAGAHQKNHEVRGRGEGGAAPEDTPLRRGASRLRSKCGRGRRAPLARVARATCEAATGGLQRGGLRGASSVSELRWDAVVGGSAVRSSSACGSAARAG